MDGLEAACRRAKNLIRNMLALLPHLPAHQPLRLLCLGAHSDDLEIGCAGTLLTWLAGPRPVDVTWVVLSANGERRAEAQRSARALLRPARSTNVRLGEFTDSQFPAEYNRLKVYFETLKASCQPDLVLTHRLDDRHQDHRLVAELTWNTWRDQVVLEYEIMKYEGDLGHPGVFVPLAAAVARRKHAHLQRHFGSQRAKHWFNEANFEALARLRGLECRAPSGLAEAFHARKLVLALNPVGEA